MNKNYHKTESEWKNMKMEKNDKNTKKGIFNFSLFFFISPHFLTI